MDSKIIGIAIGAAIGIMVLAGVLMPVLDDATATTDTLTNDGYYRMTYVEDTDVSFVWTKTAPTTVTINSNDVDISNLPNDRWLTVMCADQFCVRINMTNSGVSVSIQAFGTFSGLGAGTSGSRTSLTATCTEGAISVSDGVATRTGAYTSGIYYIDPNGSYVMKNANESAYMFGDSPIFATGVSQFSGIAADFVYNLSGNITDGVTATSVNTPEGTTTGTVTVNKTDNSKYVGLYNLTTMTFDVTPSGGTAQTVTYSYYIVPYQIEDVPRAEHLTDGQSNLLLAIPVLIIVAILIGVVALIIRSRLD